MHPQNQNSWFRSTLPLPAVVAVKAGHWQLRLTAWGWDDGWFQWIGDGKVIHFCHPTWSCLCVLLMCSWRKARNGRKKWRIFFGNTCSTRNRSSYTISCSVSLIQNLWTTYSHQPVLWTLWHLYRTSSTPYHCRSLLPVELLLLGTVLYLINVRAVMLQKLILQISFPHCISCILCIVQLI